jgi:hypothetical protein
MRKERPTNNLKVVPTTGYEILDCLDLIKNSLARRHNTLVDNEMGYSPEEKQGRLDENTKITCIVDSVMDDLTKMITEGV